MAVVLISIDGSPAGPSIVSGARVGVLDQRDVAPTAAAMLGLTMATAERPPSPLILRR